MPEERLRLFVAVPLPADVKAALQALTRDLMRLAGPSDVRWVGAEAMHVTLKFLGEVLASRVEAIAAAVAEAAGGAAPFTLRFNRLGAFPSPTRPRVIWVGMEGDTEALLALQQRAERALVRLGFAPESRPFAAHVTLGRVREVAAPAALGPLTALLAAGHPVSVPAAEVVEVVLFRSVLSRAGAVYTRLAVAGLGVE